MTLNSALKKKVRARMAATGENYTTALRAITGDTRSPLAKALQPGTVTLAINAGGQLNTALFVSHLTRLAREGHELVVAPRIRGDAPSLDELPSLLDLVVASGDVTADEALSLHDDVDRLLAAAAAAFPRSVHHVEGQMPALSLASELRRLRQESGKAPVLYVQDVQEGGAVRVTPYDDEVAQVAALRELAATTGTIIAAGHCMPAAMEQSWLAAATAASTTFAIEDVGYDERKRPATLHHYVDGVKLGDFTETIDMTPFAWRTERFRRDRASRPPMLR